MTEFKGTPGPWATEDGRHGRVLVRAANNVIVAKSMRASLVDTDEEEANAHLIAAAPELLALAERLAADISEDTGCECVNCQSQRDARAIVARIKGE